MKKVNDIEIFIDADFKDESPIKTVEKIKRILANYNIETIETWLESSVPYCYALRVSVKGTTFGTNGKGVTKEFALASGYGELMERLQLGYVGSDDVQKDGSFSLNDVQSVHVSAEQLLLKNRRWYELLAERLRFSMGKEMTAEEILMQYADEYKNVIATPYYCITKNTTEYFPTVLRKNVYTANGCAAGNTTEEAVVQAISEVVVRHHQLRIYYENINVPEIPEEVIKKYSIAYKIITYLRERRFKVVIKDCSLGEKFPVIAACIIDKNTGKYHTHFGAYPVFEIALERALTESFQGRDISRIAAFDDFRYGDQKSFDVNMLLNELTKGAAEKYTNFFVGEKKFAYNNEMGFSGKNNKELFSECIDYFKEKGFDVLVRDCSCLGFPTYQVLVPGYSETFFHRLYAKFNDRRYGQYAKKVLRNPSEATLDDMLGFLMHLTQNSKISGNISNRHGFPSGAALSMTLTPQENTYMMAATLAYVNYSMNNHGEAIKHINTMLRSSNVKDETYLVCIKRYLSMLINKYDTEQIKKVLGYFHNEDIILKLYDCIEKNKNPLEMFTLHCDGLCDEKCILRNSCCQKKVHEIANVITLKTKELDFKAHSDRLAALYNA